MNHREFFYLVSEMRSAQREYFDTKSQRVLIAAKQLEKQVDLEIERVKQIVSTQDQSSRSERGQMLQSGRSQPKHGDSM